MKGHATPPRFGPWLALPIALAAISALARWSHANATTAGLLYLLVVLGVATWGGWLAGMTAALAAVVCLNYFLFPPFGTQTIAEPANWVALGVIFVAAIVTSTLA